VCICPSQILWRRRQQLPRTGTETLAGDGQRVRVVEQPVQPGRCQQRVADNSGHSLKARLLVTSIEPRSYRSAMRSNQSSGAGVRR